MSISSQRVFLNGGFMKLREIYNLAVEAGIKADPRGEEQVRKLLAKAKDDCEKLSDDDKPYFDRESLSNPYADTRILTGEPDTEIKHIIAGIDMESAEVLLADRLREKGEKIDLVLTHHPEGKALAALDKVMGMQADIWHQFGVPINVGDMLITRRAEEVKRGLSPVNHNRAVDAARLLDLPLMCVHTPADNLVSQFLNNLFADKEPYLLSDVVKILRDVPEYGSAAKLNAGPNIIVGPGNRRAGKILVMMTGGTGGPEDSIEKLAAAGVGTIVEMHLAEKLRKKAEEFGLNVVIAGHIASDSIGVNLYLDKLENQGINIIAGSGLIRVKR